MMSCLCRCVRWPSGNRETHYMPIPLKRAVWVLIGPLGNPYHPRRDSDDYNRITAIKSTSIGMGEV